MTTCACTRGAIDIFVKSITGIRLAASGNGSRWIGSTQHVSYNSTLSRSRAFKKTTAKIRNVAPRAGRAIRSRPTVQGSSSATRIPKLLSRPNPLKKFGAITPAEGDGKTENAAGTMTMRQEKRKAKKLARKQAGTHAPLRKARFERKYGPLKQDKKSTHEKSELDKRSATEGQARSKRPLTEKRRLKSSASERRLDLNAAADNSITKAGAQHSQEMVRIRKVSRPEGRARAGGSKEAVRDTRKSNSSKEQEAIPSRQAAVVPDDEEYVIRQILTQATTPPIAEDRSMDKKDISGRKNKPPDKSPEESEGPTGDTSEKLPARRQKPEWQILKESLKKKFGGEAWNPRKRLSPDSLNGIRALHDSNPELYSMPVLAKHFAMSPEAVRRILKSRWMPKEKEIEDRRKRWERRGESRRKGIREQEKRSRISKELKNIFHPVKDPDMHEKFE